MNTYTTLIVYIVLIILFVRYFLYIIYDKLTFYPYKATHEDIQNLKQKFGDRIEVGSFKGGNGNILWYALYNKYRKPSWDDNITFYCRGCAKWLEEDINGSCMDILSKYGSVFIFDYGGFGMSTGTPTEHGLYVDTKSAWNFMVNDKGVRVDNVIIVGHSLGCSTAAYITHHLHRTKQKIPKYLILSAPFYDSRTVASDFIPVFGKLNHNLFETNKFLQTVKGLIKVIYIHSKDDEVVNVYHSHKLREKIDGLLLIIEGSHTDFLLTDDAKIAIHNAYMSFGKRA